MRLLVLSDLHLEFSDLVVPQSVEFDVAVLAGDICCPGVAAVAWVRQCPALQRARAVVMVGGNHESYDTVLQHEQRAMQSAARRNAVPPLHLLDCSTTVIDGVRFLGCTLWTDFELAIDSAGGPRRDAARGMSVAGRRMADYRCIQWLEGAAPRRLTVQDTLLMHRQQRAWLERALAEPFDGPTVVITHHGPHRGSLAPRFAADWVSTAYLSELPRHFFDVPVLWIHGHTHSSHDYLVGGCRVVCNPRGYHPATLPLPENPHFDAQRVVDVEAKGGMRVRD
jgi:predicted phosphodiesterase